MSSDGEHELTEPWEVDYRLPRHQQPLHYQIHLHPDLETGLFTGKVDIFMKINQSKYYFILHSKFLNITSTKVCRGHTLEGGEELRLHKAFEYPPNEFYIIQLKDEASAGEYTISLEFDGSLTREIVGFYRSTYRNDKNELRPIASSKFEPTYARRAFPCMDEPCFKSTFTVSLVRPTDRYMAYSNMPQVRAVDDWPRAGLTTVHFAESVKMVTYLACFIVCDFEARLAHTTRRGVPVRAIGRPDQFASTAYPLRLGVEITDFYEQYFDYPYVLPKLDLIGIPDFVSGAMEHWGLVTFRETALLFNPDESSTSNQKRVATVVAHELTHQWFGNLMTVGWWDDLWLNEGFASYIEYKGTNAVHPDWDIETQMLNDDVQVVFKLDAKLSSHPIVQYVDHPDAITELFDKISYSKGSAVLKMLEHFMEPHNFQQGIRNFLKKFAFENAATPDLWASLQEVTPSLNISRVMDMWTRQTGYPVLTCRRQDDRLLVSQSRFLTDPTNASRSAVRPSPYDYKWDVPVCYRTDTADPPSLVWLRHEDDHVSIPLAGASWIKLNAGQNGFFRVNYAPDDWQALAKALDDDVSTLGAADRWGIIDDSFSLAEAGSLPYAVALSTARFLRNDRHPVPWNSASDKLNRISSLVYGTDLYPAFRKYMISLVERVTAEVGWNPVDGHLNKSLQTTIMSLACSSGHEPCLNGAAERFQRWIATGVALEPDFRTLVYRHGMAAVGDAASWNVMWERFTAETDPQESAKLLYGMAFPKEPWLIQQYLEYAKDDTYVRSQDYFAVLEYISQNPVGLPIVWDYIRTEWECLVARFTLNNRYLGNMVNSVSSRFTTQLRLKEMKEFFAQYPEAGAGARGRKEALENVQNNIRWLATYRVPLKEWLTSNGFSA